MTICNKCGNVVHPYIGKETYKGYDIIFWQKPKTILAVVWHPMKLSISEKRFRAQDKHGVWKTLRDRIANYIDKTEKLNAKN